MRDYCFEGIRRGVGQKNQLVIMAYVSDDFAKNTDLRVKMTGVEMPEKVTEPAFVMDYARMSVAMMRRMGNPRLTRVMAIVINMDDIWCQQDETGHNRIGSGFVDGVTVADSRGNILYKSSKGEFDRCMHEVNSAVQAVIYEGEHTIIKGWALDYGQTSVKVKDENGSELGFEMNGLLAPDVVCAYPEYVGDAGVGFFLKVKTGGRSCRLEIMAGAEHDETENSKTGCVETLGQEALNWEHRITVYKIAGLGIFGKSRAGVRIKNVYARFRFYIKRNGIKSTLRRCMDEAVLRFSPKNVNYTRWLKKRLPSSRELSEQRQEKFAVTPRFSILVPLYESDRKLLVRLIESVKAQTYANWELCFSDGSRDRQRLRDMLKPYIEKDYRIRYIGDGSESLGISENTNRAYSIATGDYMVLGDHDDLFAPDALYECVKAINEDGSIDIIYSDEDKVDEKERKYFDPNFKPDFNLDLLRSTNYICHMFVVRKSVVEKAGLFNAEYDGAQDYDFILRCVERADKIHHIPKILYHWRAHINSTASAPEAKLYAYNAGRAALQAHFDRLGIQATADHSENLGYYKTNYAVCGQPLVSIVIPNKDHIDELKKCMESIDEKSTYRNYEYIIVENNSTQKEIFDFYKTLSKRENVRVLHWKGDFNYSAINNYGVAQADGEYILLLNNDIEMINPDCIEQLLGCCQRDDVGAVGAKLYYEDGTLQHAGVIIGLGGIAGHAFSGFDESGHIYQLRSKLSCDYSAVTAACLMTKKSLYEAVGGLDEDFRVAFNDIDYCMKLGELGKLVVYNANARLYHYESKSRGADDTPEKLERFSGEIHRFEQKWPEILLNGDPCYNVNLTLSGTDYGLRR